MKLKSRRTSAIINTVAAVLIIIAGCKKSNLQANNTDTKPVFTPMPDTVMFASRLETDDKSSLGTTIYVFNAVTGALNTQYHYPYQPNTTWTFPAAGNGFLYSLESNKINAINMNTGVVLWTDTVNNYSVPVLHDNVFYGIYVANRVLSNPPYETITYGVYALDATKPSKTYLWKYEANDQSSISFAFPFDNNSPAITPLVRYYNGTIYVTPDQLHLTALDAQTGGLKWKISTTASAYSLAALNNGVIMAGNTAIDATTGSPIATVNPTAVPPVYGPQTHINATLEYATQALYFVKTSHFNTPPGLSTSYLSAVDRTSGAEKWRANYGSGQVDYDSVYQVSQLWNNQLVVKKINNTGAGKYGVNRTENYRLLNSGNGSLNLTFADLNKGITIENFIVNNTMYFNKTGYAVGPFTTVPPPGYLFAIDLVTGKQKWDNDQLLAGYSGNVYSCVFSGGKGFSPFIQ